MCRTIHSLLATVICGIQMFVRVFMTTILMIENVIRMLLQTMYNFFSFMLQMISLIPICVVFLLTARLKCFMCGGGGPCPVNRGGACDCLMSLFAIIILFFIFRATGVLDKIFYSIGYAKATTHIARFVPTPGEITECSRNDTDTEYIFYPIETTTDEYEDEGEDTATAKNAFLRQAMLRSYWSTTTESTEITTSSTTSETMTTFEMGQTARFRADIDEHSLDDRSNWWEENVVSTTKRSPNLRVSVTRRTSTKPGPVWTTVLYYLI